MSRPTRNYDRSFDTTPLWSHVTVLEAPGVGQGGNYRKWSCTFCNKKVTSSYSKVKAHLLKLSGHGFEICRKVDDDTLRVLDNWKKEDNDAEKMSKSLALSAKQKNEYITLPEVSNLIQPKKMKRTVK